MTSEPAVTPEPPTGPDAATTFYANSTCDDVAYVEIMFQDFVSSERVEPYALFGDTGGDFKQGLDLEAGNYDLSARAFDDQNQLLDTLSITFDPI